jgi:membrane protein
MTAIFEKLPDVHVGRLDLTDVAKETVKELSDDDVSGLAAEMAYHSILAIFPFLLFLAGLTSIIQPLFGVGNLTDRIVEKASHVMPDDATSLLRSFTSEVVHSQGWGAITFGLIGSLWASSATVGVAMKAFNRAYDVKEDRGFVKRKLVAIALTVGFALFLIAATILIATGSIMAGGIGHALGWRSEFVQLWNWLTLPAALALVICAVGMMYWLAPNTKHEFKWVTPGALLFAVGWIVASLLLALYISKFGSYNRTYGSLGAVIVLLVWLYWTNMLVLIGGELNAVLAKREDPAYRREQGSRPTDAGSKAQP